MAKRVAVIGAGPSGIAATKCCLDEGLQPVCFERTDSIGGLWHYTEEVREGQACVMETTVINSSKEMTCYSDFPMPKEFPNFCHNSKVMEYFHNYCQQFGLKKHIRFNHEIIMITKSADIDKSGQWKIKYRDRINETDAEETFDFVLVCTGHHAYPNDVTFEDQDRFKGTIMHSHDLKGGLPFKDQRVLVVGAGNSAMDAAGELGNYAKQVFLSTRRGSWVMPRTAAGGYPADMVYGNRMGTYLGRLFPRFFESVMLEAVNKQLDHALYGLQPAHGPMGAHPSVSDILPVHLIRGKVVVKPNVKRFTRHGVEFDDGTVEDDIDAVIMCTGYVFGFPFIDKSVIDVKNNQVNLYKYMFIPQLQQQTLAIIGCVQPIGSTITIAEIQSRLAARVFSGKANLPSSERMQTDVDKKREAMSRRYVRSQRHTIQVDYVDYMDQIAELIGCRPTIWKYFFTNIRLWSCLVFEACTPVQYRLEGPGKWDGAEETILTTWKRVQFPLQTRKVPPLPKTSSEFTTIRKVALLTLTLGGVYYIMKKQNIDFRDHINTGLSRDFLHYIKIFS